MRTSEIDGLQWKNVDLQRREIHIREALVNGELGGTKTYGSDRTIQMSDRVYQAFLQQKSLNNGKSEFVFCNRDGGPLDYRLVNKRVWHPILRFLGLKPRRAYQTRHTAATLWLSAGENPNGSHVNWDIQRLKCYSGSIAVTSPMLPVVMAVHLKPCWKN